jgi:hypothetical protein
MSKTLKYDKTIMVGIGKVTFQARERGQCVVGDSRK